MTNVTTKIASAAFTVCLFASAASAEPVSLSDAKMDSIVAGGVDVMFVEGFVCPVITTAAVLNSPHGASIGEGHYTILGPNVTVPRHATNDDGAGVPPGPHLAPGEVGYTAIWGIRP